jgi:hypothetical protein
LADVPVRVADQADGVEHCAGWMRRVLQGVFAPPGAQDDAAVNVQSGGGDGGLGVLRVHVHCGAAHDWQEKRCFVRFHEAGGEHLVDQRPASGFEHAAEQLRAKRVSGASPPSNSSTRASAGLMSRYSSRSVLVATSWICRASSTPMG